ncbi:MAG: hypothetical protein FWF52_08375 [Candidatus Azobacteroides sp.]|nr:hypothetical protein [Candidatus Azobacteroides sp.]
MKKTRKQSALYMLLVVIGIFFWSCERRGERKPARETEIENPVPVDTVPRVVPNIHVYIENSGSMDGYVKGKTEFKGAIRDLLVLLKYHYNEDSIKVFFINNGIKESDTKKDLAAFSQDIEVIWRKGQEKKDWLSTNLNQIFKMILKQTDNHTISILFSDCIYSIHGSSNTVELLNDEKSLTKDAFLSKWKNDQIKLATTIVKMKSKFNGKYYPYTGDNKGFMINMERPYYICIMADPDLLADFNKNIELKENKIEGFENKYVLSFEDPKNIYYSVLLSSFSQGRFKPDRTASAKDYVHGIRDVKLDNKNNLLTFAVAVDFSSIQAENDYLTNPANYIVTTDNFDITEIIPASKNEIKPNDWRIINSHNPTHIIVLEAKTKSVSNVSFVLKKQIPQWVNDSSTEDDTTESRLVGQTFGLKYWVAGIEEAYKIIYPDDNHFFECSISIK